MLIYRALEAQQGLTETSDIFPGSYTAASSPPQIETAAFTCTGSYTAASSPPQI